MHSIVPLGPIRDSMPKIKSPRTVKSLRDLYNLFSRAKAFKRYGCCWDYFPDAFTIDDLDSTAAEIRKHLRIGLAEELVIAKEPHSCFVYSNLDKRNLLQMLRCIHSLRVDMLRHKKTNEEKVSVIC